MERFQYTRARTIPEAIGIAAQSTTAQQGAPVRFVAGGTTLVDLMKLDVERPTHLVDINGLGLNKIERTSDGGLRIGALVHERKTQTRVDALAVHVDRAGAALPVIAPLLRAGQVHRLAQRVEKRGARVDPDAVRRAVDP